MPELDTAGKVLVAAAALNIALSVVALVVEGPVPSAVVYPVALGVGIWRTVRSRGRGSTFFLVAAVVFLLVHVVFLREALSGSCVHPYEAARACNEALWLLWLGLAPLVLAAVAARGLVAERRGRAATHDDPLPSRRDG